MKMILLGFLISVFFTCVISAQQVSGISINDIQTEYIEISPVPKADNKFVVDVDFGQVNATYKLKDLQIKDSAGAPMRFNSIMDALNFISGFNYELVDTYITTSESSSSPHFIMRRKQAVSVTK